MIDQTPRETLDQLGEPWRLALQLAWEAHCVGNIGVGAVLTDEKGIVVAKGRNRVCDEDAPSGRLYQTFIAHAEIDVLGQLAPGDYRKHTIWATLEPCLLCSAAIIMSNVGRVRFAAKDELWGFLSRLPEIGEFVADRWPDRHGPLEGPVASFCELLPLTWFLSNKPGGLVVARYSESHPALFDLGRRLIRSNQLTNHRDQPVALVLGELWHDLMMIDSPG